MFKNLKRLATVILILNLLGHPAFAGSGPATLTCKSKVSKKAVSLTGKVPGDEGTDLTLIQGANTIRLDSNNNADAHVLEAFEQGVFTMIINIRKGEEELKVYAIPKSIKFRKSSGSIHSKFDAVLALNSSNEKNRIEALKMSCAYDYEI
jgi:hypothetical protein